MRNEWKSNYFIYYGEGSSNLVRILGGNLTPGGSSSKQKHSENPTAPGEVDKREIIYIFNRDG